MAPKKVTVVRERGGERSNNDAIRVVRDPSQLLEEENVSYIEEEWENFKATKEAENAEKAADRGKKARERLANDKWVQEKLAKAERELRLSVDLVEKLRAAKIVETNRQSAQIINVGSFQADIPKSKSVSGGSKPRSALSSKSSKPTTGPAHQINNRNTVKNRPALRHVNGNHQQAQGNGVQARPTIASSRPKAPKSVMANQEPLKKATTKPAVNKFTSTSSNIRNAAGLSSKDEQSEQGNHYYHHYTKQVQQQQPQRVEQQQRSVQQRQDNGAMESATTRLSQSESASHDHRPIIVNDGLSTILEATEIEDDDSTTAPNISIDSVALIATSRTPRSEMDNRGLQAINSYGSRWADYQSSKPGNPSSNSRERLPVGSPNGHSEETTARAGRSSIIGFSTNRNNDRTSHMTEKNALGAMMEDEMDFVPVRGPSLEDDRMWKRISPHLTPGSSITSPVGGPGLSGSSNSSPLVSEVTRTKPTDSGLGLVHTDSPVSPMSEVSFNDLAAVAKILDRIKEQGRLLDARKTAQENLGRLEQELSNQGRVVGYPSQAGKNKSDASFKMNKQFIQKVLDFQSQSPLSDKLSDESSTSSDNYKQSHRTAKLSTAKVPRGAPNKGSKPSSQFQPKQGSKPADFSSSVSAISAPLPLSSSSSSGFKDYPTNSHQGKKTASEQGGRRPLNAEKKALMSKSQSQQPQDVKTKMPDNELRFYIEKLLSMRHEEVENLSVSSTTLYSSTTNLQNTTENPTTRSKLISSLKSPSSSSPGTLTSSDSSSFKKVRFDLKIGAAEGSMIESGNIFRPIPQQALEDSVDANRVDGMVKSSLNDTTLEKTEYKPIWNWPQQFKYAPPTETGLIQTRYTESKSLDNQCSNRNDDPNVESGKLSESSSELLNTQDMTFLKLQEEFLQVRDRVKQQIQELEAWNASQQMLLDASSQDQDSSLWDPPVGFRKEVDRQHSGGSGQDSNLKVPRIEVAEDGGHRSAGTSVSQAESTDFTEEVSQGPLSSSEEIRMVTFNQGALSRLVVNRAVGSSPLTPVTPLESSTVTSESNKFLGPSTSFTQSSEESLSGIQTFQPILPQRFIARPVPNIGSTENAQLIGGETVENGGQKLENGAKLSQPVDQSNEAAVKPALQMTGLSSFLSEIGSDSESGSILSHIDLSTTTDSTSHTST